MAPITIVIEDGSTFNVDVDLDMELENVMALLEAETGIPPEDQLLFHSGKQLTGAQTTLAAAGVPPNEVLLLRQKSAAPTGGTNVAGRDVNTESETMRRQLLGNPQVMERLRQHQPELAAAAVSDPARFRELLAQFQAMQDSVRLQQQHEEEMLDSDPYNVEAQAKIAEHIRQQAVLENMESAMENMPEAFGSVHMLYVNVEVNGQAVKAFVDSGAQATIMSPQCAERCGIMRLLDTRFAGMARGVGTAKILGRVHSAQLKVGDLYLQCSFTIMEGKDVDLLFGLDMLKRHQATIDLAKDALIIQGREIRFLPEHELPKMGGGDEEEFDVDNAGNPVPKGSLGASGSGSGAIPGGSGSTSNFPGSGHTLASSSNPVASSSSSSSSPSAASPSPPTSAAARAGGGGGGGSAFPEADIATLIGFGMDRSAAVQLLEASHGNVEVAANLHFSGGF